MSMLRVELAYATARDAELIPLDVREGTTVMEAIQLSGLLARHPEIDVGPGKVGIFGKACAGDTLLKGGERIEIYRPLAADPKEARRRRAARQKKIP